MDRRLDEMTKVLAEAIPRREALWRLGGLFGGVPELWKRLPKIPEDAACTTI
jgi:hypothetical protein